MKFTVAIIEVVLCLAFVSARTAATKKSDVGYYHGSNDNTENYQQGGGHTYSEGDSLKSIAQGSANQANLAVAEQYTIARQAAYAVQNTLAQAAVQASATAQAALAGKEVLFHNLEHQYIEAEKALEAELRQLELAQRAAKSAKQATQQALTHVTSLQTALNSAESSLNQAQFAGNEASLELASQSAMVGKAKSRLAALGEQLNYAHVDFEETQNAAAKAARSAQTAQSNAASAAIEQSKYAIASSDAGTQIAADSNGSAGGKYHY